MDDGCNQSAGDGNGQADKALLVDFDGAFGKDPRSRGLNIKTRETKRAAHQVHKREKPRQAVQTAALFQRGAVAPNISEHCRR